MQPMLRAGVVLAFGCAAASGPVHPPTDHPSFKWGIRPAIGVLKSDSPDQQLDASYASDGAGGLLITGTLGSTGSIGEVGEESNLTVFQQRDSNATYSLSAGATRILRKIMANSVFVIQVTSLGTIAWVVPVGDASDLYSTGIAPDGLGGALVTAHSRTSGGLKVMRIDDTGTIVWEALVRGSVMSNGIESDGARGALVTGSFKGAVSFGVVPLVCEGDARTSCIFLLHVLSDDGGARAFTKTGEGSIDWAIKAGLPGPSASVGSAIASDGMGGAFVMAHLASKATTTFGSYGELTTKTGDSARDSAFVMHVSYSGAVNWLHPVHWAGKEAFPTGIAADGGGGALVTGSFFDASGTADESLESTFVMRVSHYGEILWAVQVGRPLDRMSGHISSDGAGGALVTGTTTLATRPSQHDYLFVMRVTSLGSIGWAVLSGAVQHVASIEIVPDGASGALVAGSFQGSATFGATTLQSGGQTDIFVTRLELLPETPPSPPGAPPPPAPSAPPLQPRDHGWPLAVLLSVAVSCAALLALASCCFRRRLRRAKLVAENLRDSRDRAELDLRMLAHRWVAQEPSAPSVESGRSDEEGSARGGEHGLHTRHHRGGRHSRSSPLLTYHRHGHSVPPLSSPPVSLPPGPPSALSSALSASNSDGRNVDSCSRAASVEGEAMPAAAASSTSLEMTISTQMTIWDAVDAVAAEESWWVEDGEEGYAIGTADEMLAEWGMRPQEEALNKALAPRPLTSVTMADADADTGRAMSRSSSTCESSTYDSSTRSVVGSESGAAWSVASLTCDASAVPPVSDVTAPNPDHSGGLHAAAEGPSMHAAAEGPSMLETSMPVTFSACLLESTIGLAPLAGGHGSGHGLAPLAAGHLAGVAMRAAVASCFDDLEHEDGRDGESADGSISRRSRLDLGSISRSTSDEPMAQAAANLPKEGKGKRPHGKSVDGMLWEGAEAGGWKRHATKKGAWIDPTGNYIESASAARRKMFATPEEAKAIAKRSSEAQAKRNARFRERKRQAATFVAALQGQGREVPGTSSTSGDHQRPFG